MVGRATEVHEREVVFPGVGVHPLRAADDLLELGHRTDFAIKDDQAAGLGVHPRAEQAGCGDDHGVGRFRVDEVS